mgnify:CR=1 FL=1
MSKYELPKAYDFKDTEARIYAMWEAGGYFKPHNDPNKPDFDPNVEPFVISIPPPNVTGTLHMGHGFNNTVMDTLIRFNRMRGRPTLWQTSTDHAGIATQMDCPARVANRAGPAQPVLRRPDADRIPGGRPGHCPGSPHFGFGNNIKFTL